jgi:hypothetical protein
MGILKKEVDAYLKLALSIHAQPIFTTQRASCSSACDVSVEFVLSDMQGCVRSGKRNPLSLANCSRQIGKNSVRETMTKTSLDCVFAVSLTIYQGNIDLAKA